ncbi:MAG: tRNA (cytidine(34)-2'-O)-methyltransferase [Acidobacteriota bacterium]
MNAAHQYLNIVLVEPEIHPNTGNIARLCAATGTDLHLIEPLGFRTDEAAVKRAGLDYWPYVKLHKHINYTAFKTALPEARCWFFTTKAQQSYTSVTYGWNDCLVFGSETRGLPTELLTAHWQHCVTIPMLTKHVRSLNLATAAAIALYEALRQLGQTSSNNSLEQSQ